MNPINPFHENYFVYLHRMLTVRCRSVFEVEKCHCLQGVQFIHSASGGTGSGLTGLVLKTLRDFLDKQSKCILQNFVLAPAPGISDIVLEPYNSALCFQDLFEYSDQVFLFDNKALAEICHRAQDIEMPKMADMNQVVAKCMSGITSCLRYTGPLNADLRKLNTNLVPFQKSHFLISGFAPLTAPASRKYRKESVLDLALQMFSKDNVTVKCDPLNPGDPYHQILKARFLASWASWRGNYQTKEVDKARERSRKDFFSSLLEVFWQSFSGLARLSARRQPLRQVLPGLDSQRHRLEHLPGPQEVQGAGVRGLHLEQHGGARGL